MHEEIFLGPILRLKYGGSCLLGQTAFEQLERQGLVNFCSSYERSSVTALGVEVQRKGGGGRM